MIDQGVHSETALLLGLFDWSTPSWIKVRGWGGVGGGLCDFSVSPSPFGLDFGTLDFGTSDLGLTIVQKEWGRISLRIFNTKDKEPKTVWFLAVF